MNEWALAGGSAFWLGILTSISPCLMATNVAAISYIARRVGHPKYVLLTGAFYTAGQTSAFILLGMAMVASLLEIPLASQWLQTYMFRFLGPILILVGMFLLELLRVNMPGGALKQWAQERSEAGGLGVAVLLGVAFGMSFCPTTAALFFGSLVPLAILHQSSFFLPLLYGLGVATPVVAFGLLIALAATQVGKVFKQVSRAELWARRATGVIFVLIGIFFTLAFTVEVF